MVSTTGSSTSWRESTWSARSRRRLARSDPLIWYWSLLDVRGSWAADSNLHLGELVRTGAASRLVADVDLVTYEEHDDESSNEE